MDLCARGGIARYLDRIGLDEADLPNGLEALVSAVATAQHARVPFENLGIHAGRVVGVEPARIAQRLVDDRRGGICYELNGLLLYALRALGVPAVLHGARVDSGAGFGPADGHVAVVVPGDPAMLVDVGFGGDMILRPIDLADPAGRDVSAGAARYRIDPAVRELDEFAGMARWHSTSGQSRFTGSVICTLPVDAGRRTMTGRIDPESGRIDYRMIEVDGDSRREYAVAAADVPGRLSDVFGIDDPRPPMRSAVGGHR